MNVTANIETVSLAQGGTSVAAKAKTFDEPQQAFSDSLSAVSKATSQTDSRDDGNTKATSRKKSTSEDTESTSSADQSSTARSSVVSQFVTQPEQAVPVQQTPVSASSGNLSGKTVAIADTKAEKAVQSSTAESSDDPSQTASLVAGPTAQKVEASGVPLSEAANSVSDVDANGVTNTTTNARSIENSSAVANASADASVDADSSMNANGIRNLAQNAILNGALSAVRSAVTVETAPGVSAGMASNSAAGNASANQVTPSAIVSEQTLPATTTDTSASVSNQIASLNKTGDESSVAIRAGVSNFKLASTAKSSVTSAADGKTVTFLQKLGEDYKVIAEYKHALETVPKSIKYWTVLEVIRLLMEMNYITETKAFDSLEKLEAFLTDKFKRLQDGNLGIEEFDNIILYDETKTDPKNAGYCNVEVLL